MVRTHQVRPAVYPPDRDAIRQAVTELHGYVVDLIDIKQQQPGDDLLSALVTIEQDGDRLSRDELTSLAFLILFAGYENTANLIASAVRWLLDHGGLNVVPISEATEGTLRHEPPAPVAFPPRTSSSGASRFRPVTPSCSVSPPPPGADGNAARLAFGNGPHYCLGAALARVEAEEALTVLARRLPGLTLAVPPSQVRWRPTFRTHGPAELLVGW